MMKTRRLFVIAAACLLTGGLIAVAVVWYHNYPAHRFVVVEEGVLYRSGQPDVRELGTILDAYHIRTVFNLRGQTTTEPWWQAEEEFCRHNGIGHVNMAVDSGMEDAFLEELLRAAADPQRRPILIHCREGRTRTGVMVAAYRIAAQGWSYAAALDEAEKCGFDPQMYHQYDGYLKALAARVAAHPAGGLFGPGPTSSRPAAG
jgi:protein tyrosine phosphatase (PTP) superfamily phosphohydrolase (DUF442 family)